MMRVLTNYIFAMLLSLLFQSCSSPKPQKSDFVGTWKANDGATIELYENGDCTISKLNFKKIDSFKNDTVEVLNCNGSWELINIKDAPRIDISYYDGKTYEYKGEIKKYKRGFDFEISGQGAFGNKPPWGLYKILGDPEDIDESNKYKFEKQ